MAQKLFVRDILHGKTLSCPPHTSVLEASKMMDQSHFSSILVVEEGQMVGIWTERDALHLEINETLNTTPIAQVMSSPVFTIHVDESLDEAAHKLKQNRIRHLLVVDDNKMPRGIISQTDLILSQSVEYYLTMRELGQAMRPEVHAINAEQPLSEATRMMQAAGADAILVEFSDNHYGILTERDLIHHIANHELSHDPIVAEVASRDLICASSEDSLYSTRNLMLSKGIRHIGVVDEAKSLTGLVSFADILSAIELAYVNELRENYKKRSEALMVSNQHLHLAERVIEASLNGIMITDPHAVIQSVNPSFSRITGYSPEEVIGKTPKVLNSGRHNDAFYDKMWQCLQSNGSWHGEIWNRRKSGELYAELLTITAIHDDHGHVSNYTAIFSDITQSKYDEERNKRLAYYDPLTELPNRRLFEDRLSVAISLAERKKIHLGLLFIDIDDFKQINDQYGHNTGDTLIRRCAHALRSTLRESDTIARIGGDEFVIITHDTEHQEQLEQLAHRLLKSATAPVEINGQLIRCSISIGAAIFPTHGNCKHALLSEADKAMYRAKQLGKNCFAIPETV